MTAASVESIMIGASTVIEINLTTVAHTVNPVFEVARAPQKLARVTLDGKVVSSGAYAWDGKTLWISTTIDRSGAKIAMVFQ